MRRLVDVHKTRILLALQKLMGRLRLLSWMWVKCRHACALTSAFYHMQHLQSTDPHVCILLVAVSMNG